MLELYNSYTNRKEKFVPIEPGKVRFYSCGPTVYSFAHIGNFSSFLMADLLVRYLKYSGYAVTWVQNITDVGHMTDDADDGEDKMEKASLKENKSPWEVARFYEQAFLEDAKTLNMLKADYYPRATEHVQEMIEMVKTLVEKGHAYETDDGVYFDLSTFPAYGKLSGNNAEKLNSGARIDVNEQKRSPNDFALWKKLVGDNIHHAMKWDSPWGVGFPGWHIECSAMSRKYLGDTLDIHTGGEDNKFPHHESEIAQSECCTGKQYSRFWLHKSHIMVNGEKMSKSTGNFFTIRDVIAKGYSAQALRFTYLSAHYRSKMNFSFEAVDAAGKYIDKVNDLIQDLLSAEGSSASDNSLRSIIKSTKQQFDKAMDDDLNVSAALASLFGFVKSVKKQTNAGTVSKEISVELLDFLKKIDTILAVFNFEKKAEKIFTKEEQIEIEELNRLREAARISKNWAESDRIRDLIIAKGVKIADGKAK